MSLIRRLDATFHPDLAPPPPHRYRKGGSRESFHPASHRYIGDVVYGSLDGIITTFVVVNGVAGANLSPGMEPAGGCDDDS